MKEPYYKQFGPVKEASDTQRATLNKSVMYDNDPLKQPSIHERAPKTKLFTGSVHLGNQFLLRKYTSKSGGRYEGKPTPLGG